MGLVPGVSTTNSSITAGFFKLLIPFLCIVPGMAAGYILPIDPATESDTAFAGLTRTLLPTAAS